MSTVALKGKVLTWQESLQPGMDDKLLHTQGCSDHKAPKH